jgi:hypothetical protein
MQTEEPNFRLGSKKKSATTFVMSTLPPKADINRIGWDVRKVP